MRDPDGVPPESDRKPTPEKQDLHEWLRRFKPLLKSIAAKELDKELAPKVDDSDLIQETLHAAQANIEQVADKKPKELRGYLRRVLLSKIEDWRRKYLKSQKRDVSRELTAEEISSDEFRQIIGNEGSPLDLMIDEEHFRRVMAAVQALPPEVQKVIAWRFEENMTLEEIGNRIGRTKDDVRMLLQRCIARLRKQLEES